MRDAGALITAENRMSAMSSTWGIPNVGEKIKCSFVLSNTEDSGKFILRYNLNCSGIWWVMEQFWNLEYWCKVDEYPESIIYWEGYCKIYKSGNIRWYGKFTVKEIDKIFKIKKEDN